MQSPRYARGYVFMNGQFTGYPFADFMAGYPDGGERSVVNNAFTNQIASTITGFVGDNWKVSHRLTINAGLRWEDFVQPVEKQDIVQAFYPLPGKPLNTSGNAV